jgi:hypothetical protein
MVKLPFFRGRRDGRPREAVMNGDPDEPLYSLRPDDEPLLIAALGLGDWILAQSRVSRQQEKAVGAIQDALRSLPGTPPPMIAEYGFHARYESLDGKGLYRAWRVALSPSGIEIYSVYSPDEKIEFEEKVSHELYFWQRPSHPATNDGFYYAEWIDEVADPDRFRQDAAIFGFMAEFEMSEY